MPHEGEPIRIPIKVAPDELAPESIPALPSGEIIPYTPRDANRLGAFHTMLRHVFQSEAEEREHKTPTRFGRIKDGTMVERYFDMDSRFRAIWNERADHLYNDELKRDRFTKIAADAIIFELKKEFDGPPAMSAEALQSLYDRSPDLEVDEENAQGEGRGSGFDYDEAEGGRE